MLKYKEAESWVFQKMINELDESLHYHDLKHTVDVIRAADRLCFMEHVSEHHKNLVRTAALFHDIGYCEQYLDNEDVAADIAGRALLKFNYDAADIKLIQGMIQATKIPHQPKNHLEEIICDADLDYLGRDDFHPISDNLKRELQQYEIIKTDKEWDEVQVKFFELHRFFTPSAIQLRKSKKAEHLLHIRQRLNTH